jgi:hypothetical protein
MNAALLALGALGLLVQPPGVTPSRSGSLPAGTQPARAKKPLLLGATTAAAILANRASFRDHLAMVKLTEAQRARWKAVRRPFTLVAVFGSWCGDSHRQLPDLLALDAEINPFIDVRYLGVGRDMALAPTAWPDGCPPQKVARVPTFYLFATQPGGGQKLVGKVVETPPPSRTMAAVLVDLVETQAHAH